MTARNLGHWFGFFLVTVTAAGIVHLAGAPGWAVVMTFVLAYLRTPPRYWHEAPTLPSRVGGSPR